MGYEWPIVSESFDCDDAPAGPRDAMMHPEFTAEQK
jgi:hypothetical protein